MTRTSASQRRGASDYQVDIYEKSVTDKAFQQQFTAKALPLRKRHPSALCHE
jgi:hypothetical protein